MLALFGFLAVIIMSFIVVRVGGIALELTGLSPEVAAFQAQSAFSGAGFTTNESESIVNHPLRRRIVRGLILFGSVGLTSTIATLILAFAGQEPSAIRERILILSVGLLTLFLISRSKWFHRMMKRIIVNALRKHKTLKIYDYQELFGITEGYSISRMLIKKQSWLDGKMLKDIQLHDEGILVLAVHHVEKHHEKFLGVPSGSTTLHAGDIITVYGNDESCKRLAARTKGRRGDKEHEKRKELEEKRSELKKEEQKLSETT